MVGRAEISIVAPTISSFVFSLRYEKPAYSSFNHSVKVIKSDFKLGSICPGFMKDVRNFTKLSYPVNEV